MTESEEVAERVRAALDVLQWPSNAIAKHLGIRNVKVRRWKSGMEDCPKKVLGWLEAHAERVRAGEDVGAIASDDFPEGW